MHPVKFKQLHKFGPVMVKTLFNLKCETIFHFGFHGKKLMFASVVTLNRVIYKSILFCKFSRAYVTYYFGETRDVFRIL